MNECSDSRGLATEAVIRKNRREAAMNYAKAEWEYDQKKGTYTYDMDPDDNMSVSGGVPVPSLLDDDGENPYNSRSVSPAGSTSTIRNPLGADEKLAQSADLLSMDDDQDSKFKGDTWSSRLFHGAPLTPAPDGYRFAGASKDAPRPNPRDPRTLFPGCNQMHDWDGVAFKDFYIPNEGFKCPFPGCP